MKLEAGAGLEICLAQWWSTAGTSDVDITLQFEGANIRGNLCLTGTGRIVSLYILANSMTTIGRGCREGFFVASFLF